MKVKDYLKKVEIANEVVRLANNLEYNFYMDDGYHFYNAKTYKDFKKIINEEFVKSFVEEVFERDFELNKKYYINNTAVEFSIE